MQVSGSKTLCCHDGHQKVNRCCTRVNLRRHAGEESTLALKPRAEVTRRTEQGINVPTNRTDVPQNFFLKN